MAGTSLIYAIKRLPEDTVRISVYTNGLSETYEQAKLYGRENPHKAIHIASGIGAGLRFLLGASSRRSRTGRFAPPVVKALSDIALEFLR
jgi:hypothetical protein